VPARLPREPLRPQGGRDTIPAASREAPEVPVPRPRPAVAALLLALVPACAAPTSGPATTPAPLRARLAISPFVDETPRGAGPVAEGLRLLLQEALDRDPILLLTRPPGERADLLLRGTLLDFRPAGGADPPALVTELGLLDLRNGALVIGRIVTGADRGRPAGSAALPSPLEHWAGTATEGLLQAWLASALAALREDVPAGYFVYDAADEPVAALPPPPPRTGKRPVTPDVLPGAVTPTATVTAETANLMKGPGPRYPILGELKRGEAVQVLNERGEWTNVRSSGGLEGWVFRGLLTEPRVPPPGGPPEKNP